MAGYSVKKGRASRLPRRVIVLVLVLIIIFIATAFVVRQAYNANLGPVSNNPQTKIVNIETGSSLTQIADQLHSAGLIRKTWAFEWYVRSNGLSDKLQAGTYALSPNESVATVVHTLTKGKVATRLVTILPGRRIDQVRADLINAGFTPDSVDKALDPGQYADIPALAFKPAGANLEGLLYPDSFQKTANTDPSVIVRESLQEMGQHLTPGLQTAFANEGLTTYQGIILASMIEQEVSKPADRAQAAQVFLTRLHNGMMLGSDVTAFYGSIAAGKSPSLTYDSPYNTLIHNGLPVGPISSVSESSLMAAAHPATTDWLYFVAGDDGTTYFSHTLEEHNQQVSQYCHKLCNQ